MHTHKSFISTLACLSVILTAAPLSASAEGDLLYGTMNIPYTDFYAAELGTPSQEVDAVSSATESKWSKNGEGELFEGTYNDGSGTILGVTYPVAITQAELDALDDNYSFTPLNAVPEAYKTVTVSNGKAAFSAVQDANPETLSADIVLNTETPWGDYLIDIKNTPEGFDTLYRGAILKTADGNAYAMRHEQNIWRGELAWSSGIKTSEPHGNQLDYASYVGLMGAEITEIVLITKSGYVTVETNTYVPIKFINTVSVADAEAGTGSTALATEGFPADYQKTYRIADQFTVTDSDVSYTDAMPGAYTLTISDAAGKYADVTASFTLTTDDLPVVYENGKLVTAEGFSDASAQNFIRNIASVTVNAVRYSATGKGSVKLIAEDGSIDFDAESKDGKIFADGASGSYTISVQSTGYTQVLEIVLPEDTEENLPAETTSATAPDQHESNTTGSTAQSTNESAGTKIPAAKTGDAGVGVAAALLAVSAGAAFALRKRKSY